ncbi:helix-turn-helix domain-containing protein [Brevibacillus sedimenti]|uniref:helix-turn-helix domain-containing protein n=1 Tax=Brevibacillus sedimenti TaxID=2613334 RepID=UPI001E295290|nr:helix-turn-helix domain-containing protein [Anoxybacillus sediminis]UFJ62215.1 helix-turn-helix domain-containing protein [Anoxybacillus sediminis]
MGFGDFADVLLRYRYQENITVDELAERAGVGRSVLSRIESGETKRPSFATWKKIGNALHIPYGLVISTYLDVTERAETLKFLLQEAIAHNNKTVIEKAAQKLLDTPKMQTFLALDHLFQTANGTDDPAIKLVLYDVLIEYTRKNGIPYYLAKGLYERYLLERDEFARLEETYQRGKEMLHYLEWLQPAERIAAYFRLGVHAYVLDHYYDCIELCSKCIREDHEDSRQKASALIAIVNSYLDLGDLVLAEVYLKEYENSKFADFRKKHLRALLYAKKGQHEEAIALYQECLQEAERDGRINVVTDLLDVCLETGRNDLMKELIAAEDQFFPADITSHPQRIKQTAKYHLQKGKCQISIGQITEGFDTLLKSISYYRQLGSFAKVAACIGLFIEYHRMNERNLSFEHMEIIVKELSPYRGSQAVEVLQAQAAEQLSAEPHERTDEKRCPT